MMEMHQTIYAHLSEIETWTNEKEKKEIPGEVVTETAGGGCRDRTVFELKVAPTLDEPMLVLDISEDSGQNLWLVELELDFKVEFGDLQIPLEATSSRRTERGVRL